MLGCSWRRQVAVDDLVMRGDHHRNMLLDLEGVEMSCNFHPEYLNIPQLHFHAQKTYFHHTLHIRLHFPHY